MKGMCRVNSSARAASAALPGAITKRQGLPAALAASANLPVVRASIGAETKKKPAAASTKVRAGTTAAKKKAGR